MPRKTENKFLFSLGFHYLCSYEATGIFTFVRDLDVVRFGAERAIDCGVG